MGKDLQRRERSRGWCFTVNAPEDEHALRAEVEQWCTFGEDGTAVPTDDGIKQCVWQLERGGDEGRLHVQGWVSFKNAVAFTRVKGWLGDRAHVEPQRGSPAQAAAYCSKSDRGDDIPDWGGPHWYGRRPHIRQGSRSDLDAALCQLKRYAGLEPAEEGQPTLLSGGALACHREFALDHFHLWTKYPQLFGRFCKLFRRHHLIDDIPKKTIKYVFGPTGTGKTHSAIKYLQEKYGADQVYVKSDSTTWFDGYAGHKAVVFDDFYGGTFKYSYALKIFDIMCYPLMVQVKNDYVTWEPAEIVITSNSLPQHVYRNVNNTDAWMRRVAPEGKCYYKARRETPWGQKPVAELETLHPELCPKPFGTE